VLTPALFFPLPLDGPAPFSQMTNPAGFLRAAAEQFLPDSARFFPPRRCSGPPSFTEDDLPLRLLTRHLFPEDGKAMSLFL